MTDDVGHRCDLKKHGPGLNQNLNDRFVRTMLSVPTPVYTVA